MSYGTIDQEKGSSAETRKGFTSSKLTMALALVAVTALFAVVVSNRHAAVVLEQQPAQAWAYDISGDSVPLPRTFVNYKKGTSFSVHGEFENPAMDKAVRQQQLAEEAPKQQWVYDYSHNRVAVPPTMVNYRAGTTVSPHGEFETVPMDKSVGQQQLAEQPPQQQFVYDFSHNRVAVPPTMVNFKAGTTVSPKGDWENPAMDKAVQQQQLAEEAPKQQWAYDYSHNKVAVPPTMVNYRAGTTVSPHGEFETVPMDKSVRQQQLAAKKELGLNTKAADADLDHYFATQTVAAAHHPHAAAHGLNTHAADSDLAHYFATQAQAAAKHVTKKAVHPMQQLRAVQEHAPKHGDSAAAANADLDSYFAAEQAKAAVKEVPVKHAVVHEEKKAEKGPKYGLSDAAAKAQMESYFTMQQKRAVASKVRDEQHAEHVEENVEAKTELHDEHLVQKLVHDPSPAQPALEEVHSEGSAEVEKAPADEAVEKEGVAYKKAGQDCIGKICADKFLDTPLWQQDPVIPIGAVGDHMIDAGKADCGDDMDCQSSKSPFISKSKTTQQLNN